MKLLKHFIFIVLILWNMELYATDYYIRRVGNDAYSGTSIDLAWASIAKVNATSFKPGDRILFEGGKIFTGSIDISPDDNGECDNLVTVSSYGIGRALISSGSSNGISVSGCSYVRVANINFIGASRLTGGGRGVSFSSVQYSFIDSVDVRGYQQAGVDIQSSVNIRCTNVYATDNGYVGIHATGAGSSNIYVGYCKAIANPGYPTARGHSGNGILFESGPKNSLVEYCEAAENGADGRPGSCGGPVGIWTWDVDSITVQYCISHNNHAAPGLAACDGGGFDLDGGSRSCVFQYNYSYNNFAAGMLICAKINKPITDCIIRYNIFENDGHGGHGAGISFACANDSAKNIQIYNNVIYNSAGYSCINGANNGHHIYNNIMVLRGNGSFCSGGDLAGNCYWNYDNNSAMNSGGIAANPLLVNPGNGEKLTDPTKLLTLLAYKLQANSPCIDAGIDLKTISINPGTHDFFGNAIPYKKRYDIGVHEYRKKVSR